MFKVLLFKLLFSLPKRISVVVLKVCRDRIVLIVKTLLTFSKDCMPGKWWKGFCAPMLLIAVVAEENLKWIKISSWYK